MSRVTRSFSVAPYTIFGSFGSVGAVVQASPKVSTFYFSTTSATVTIQAWAWNIPWTIADFFHLGFVGKLTSCSIICLHQICEIRSKKSDNDLFSSTSLTAGEMAVTVTRFSRKNTSNVFRGKFFNYCFVSSRSCSSGQRLLLMVVTFHA